MLLLSPALVCGPCCSPWTEAEGCLPKAEVPHDDDADTTCRSSSHGGDSSDSETSAAENNLDTYTIDKTEVPAGRGSVVRCGPLTARNANNAQRWTLTNGRWTRVQQDEEQRLREEDEETGEDYPEEEHEEDDSDKHDNDRKTYRTRDARRRRKRGGKDRKTKSVMEVFFANVTTLSPKTVEYVSKLSYHVVGLVETKVNGPKEEKIRDQIAANHWTVSSATARPTGTNDRGNHGGALIAHKPWLQAKAPIEAFGKAGCRMPDCDSVHKYFRVHGKDICLAFVYFDHSTGFNGNNLRKLEKINKLKEGGHMHVVVCGDFNAIPAEWSEDILDRLDMQIIAPKVDYTCRNIQGKSLLDYLLVSRSIAGLIQNVTTIGGQDEHEVPWSPHCGIHFEIKSEPEALWTRQIRRPKPIPIKQDAKGKNIEWHVEQQHWDDLMKKFKNKAAKKIRNQKDPEYRQHAQRLEIEAEATAIGIGYLQ